MTEPVFEAQLRRGLYTLSRSEHIGSTVTIPSEISGHPIEAIDAGVFLNDRTLTAVTVPNTVTRIDDSAFQGCEALRSVRLPDGLTYLGSFAFADCDALESIVLPENLQFIPYGGFSTCTNLSRVDFPKQLRSIGNRAFEECRSLTKLSFPRTLTEIGNAAFYNCLKLSVPDLHEGLSAIGHSAFYRSSGISPVFDTVKLPKSLALLGARAFRCRRLIIPGSTDLDVLCSEIESIRAPYLTPDAFEGSYAQYAACIGYAEMLEADIQLKPETATGYETLLKEIAEDLLKPAINHPPLMRLLIDRALIPQSAVSSLIEACRGNTELCAQLIVYSQTLHRSAVDFDISISRDEFFSFE